MVSHQTWSISTLPGSINWPDWIYIQTPLFAELFPFANGQNLCENHRQSIHLRLKLWINGCVNKGNSGHCVFGFTYYIYTPSRVILLGTAPQVYSLPRTCQCPPQTNSLCCGSNLPSHSLQDLQQPPKHCYVWANRIWGMLFLQN